MLVDRETVLRQSRCGKSFQNPECHLVLGVYRCLACKGYVVVFVCILSVGMFGGIVAKCICWIELVESIE